MIRRLRHLLLCIVTSSPALSWVALAVSIAGTIAVATFVERARVATAASFR